VPTYPNPERVLYKIGEAYQRAGKTAKALEVLGKLVQTAPSSGIAVEAQYLMGQIYEAQGDREHAFAAYQAAADANSGEAAARAQFRLAELHEQEGEWDQAARSFMRVAILFLHPELSPEALLRASRAYEKMGNVEQAQRAREELLKDFPDSPQAKSLTQESHSG
jgi:tetratricopeptide (TPR) repeat protein